MKLRYEHPRGIPYRTHAPGVGEVVIESGSEHAFDGEPGEALAQRLLVDFPSWFSVVADGDGPVGADAQEPAAPPATMDDAGDPGAATVPGPEAPEHQAPPDTVTTGDGESHQPPPETSTPGTGESHQAPPETVTTTPPATPETPQKPAPQPRRR